MPSLAARGVLRVSTVAEELSIAFHVTKFLDRVLFHFLHWQIDHKISTSNDVPTFRFENVIVRKRTCVQCAKNGY